MRKLEGRLDSIQERSFRNETVFVYLIGSKTAEEVMSPIRNHLIRLMGHKIDTELLSG